MSLNSQQPKLMHPQRSVFDGLPRLNGKISKIKRTWQGIYAMAEYHIDDKMADNCHNINFMYGLLYVLVNIGLTR